MLFCQQKEIKITAHSVISTANNVSMVFETSCVQVHVHVYTERYIVYPFKVEYSVL